MNGTEQRNHKTALETLRTETNEAIDGLRELLLEQAKSGVETDERVATLAEMMNVRDAARDALRACVDADRAQAVSMSEAQGRELEILHRMVKPLVVGLKEHDEWVTRRRRFWPRVWWLVSGR